MEVKSPNPIRLVARKQKLTGDSARLVQALEQTEQTEQTERTEQPPEKPPKG